MLPLVLREDLPLSGKTCLLSVPDARCDVDWQPVATDISSSLSLTFPTHVCSLADQNELGAVIKEIGMIMSSVEVDP